MTLQEFFHNHPKVALAFSGGTDSAYLLYAGKAHGCDIQPYYVKTAFQPQFELDDARNMASQLGIDLKVLEYDVFQHTEITQNTTDRCYACKRLLMGQILQQAKKDGYPVLIDGTNASDSEADRPGTKALSELNILSPLRECRITKAQIITFSKEAELFTWNKASNSCLATRIPHGTPIQPKMLDKVERGEDFLREKGFENFRIRLFHGTARIQLQAYQFKTAVRMREEIAEGLSGYFDGVLLDLIPRLAPKEVEHE